MCVYIYIYIYITQCCYKARYTRNKCFLNIKVAVIFGLTQSYLIYIAYIPYPSVLSRNVGKSRPK